MYKIFLSFRYLLKRRIALFAVAAVMLCTAMVLIVISVMGGFLDMVKERSRGLLSDLIVDNYSLQGFPFYQELIDELLRDHPDQFVAATPVILNYGTLRFSDNITRPVQIVGIRLAETFQVNDLHDCLYYEKFYPGSTTLAEQQQPVFGLDENLMPILPRELETALQAAAKSRPDLSAECFPPREPGLAFPGPGRYESPAFIGLVLLEQLRDDLDDMLAVARGENPTPETDPYFGPSRRRLERLRDDARRIRDRIEPLSLPAEDLEPLTHLATVLEQSAEHADAGAHDLLAASLDVALHATQLQHVLLRAHMGPAYVGPALPGVLIGTDLVGEPIEGSDYHRLYSRGDRVVVTFLPFTRKGTLAASEAISKAMRYADDFRYGVYEIDRQNIHIDFDLAQKWLGMDARRLSDELGGGTTPPRASQVQIKTRPGAKVEAARQIALRIWDGIIRRVEAQRPPGVTEDDLMMMRACDIDTWQQRQRQFVAAVEKEKVLVTTLFAVISVVAILLIGCIFYMIVQQKTRDIGIIKSIGATSGGIAAIFITYGLFVGIVGAALGFGIGSVFVHYINDIQDALARFNPNLRVWDRRTYMFDQIPNVVKPHEATIIIIVAIVSSVLGSLVPAWRAARVWPVETLRYE